MNQQVLDYGHRRLRPSIFRVAIFLVLAALAAVAWKYAGIIGHRVSILSWQRQCLNFHRLDSEVLCEDIGDPFSSKPRPEKSTWAAELPFWDSFRPFISAGNSSSTDPLGGFSSSCRSPVFLHSRKTPRGTIRLVVVEFGEKILFGKAQRGLQGRVIELATITHNARYLSENDLTLCNNFESDDLVIFGGVADAKDHATFTIRYTKNGRAFSVKGALSDDDQLVWHVSSE